MKTFFKEQFFSYLFYCSYFSVDPRDRMAKELSALGAFGAGIPPGLNPLNYPSHGSLGGELVPSLEMLQSLYNQHEPHNVLASVSYYLLDVLIPI